ARIRIGVLQPIPVFTHCQRAPSLTPVTAVAARCSFARHLRSCSRRAIPYDPEWEVSLEERLGVKMANNLRGKRTLESVWRDQNGLCPVCHQKITLMTGWHTHHLVWRVLGGAETVANR